MNARIGIIAEYNPLHNGHRLMMEAARAALGGEAPCVVVLSSNFTQRGEPALVDKWTRTRMALTCGADLVIELPFLFSCAAAPDFSAGAVDLLAPFVTHIAFGMENPDYDTAPLLDLLTREPPAFKQRLREGLARGLSYPRAVSGALEALIPGGGPFMSSPNNLLALSYLLRIHRRGYPLAPLPLPRRGEGHDGRQLGPLASAGAIRAAVTEAEIPDALAESLPGFSLSLLRKAQTEGRLCPPGRMEKLWPMLQGLLLRDSPEKGSDENENGNEGGNENETKNLEMKNLEMKNLEMKNLEMKNLEMKNLFLKKWRGASGFEDFVGRCVSARHTRSHIRRRVVRLLIGAQSEAQMSVPYARVLGFTGRGRQILREYSGELPVITRLAAATGASPCGARDSPAARWERGYASRLEFRASTLYELLLDSPDLRHEERQSPVRLD